MAEDSDLQPDLHPNNAPGMVGLAEVEESDREISHVTVVAINPDVMRDSAIAWMPAPTRSVYYPPLDPYLPQDKVIERIIITKSDGKGRAKESIVRLEGHICLSVEFVIRCGIPNKQVLTGASATLCKCPNCISEKYSGGTYWVDSRIEYEKRV